ncbi:hypothetical protein ACQR1I_03680 [Bradyrhizobium sp. HKCCYLS2038]|uniref:hypothetical protein n=1 Tax=unclassified Bradyrhizobium TaxID=2631580 RepID=UPI003EBEB0FA
MRATLWSLICLLPVAAHAGETPPRPVETAPAVDRPEAVKLKIETYRGHVLDFTEIAMRGDFPAMADRLRHQIDIVEQISGLSPRVQEFFRTIPIAVDELACLNFTKDENGKDLEDPSQLLHPACYGSAPPQASRLLNCGSVWDSDKGRWVNSDPVALAVETNLGVIMVRPILLASKADAERPVMLHEMLHAFHNRKLPKGFENPGVKLHYSRAKEQQLYPETEYLLSNAKEFFAVTGSVFLYGNDGPFTRAMLRTKQPDYYKYLVYLFGFDPDPQPSSSPMAMVN